MFNVARLVKPAWVVARQRKQPWGWEGQPCKIAAREGLAAGEQA